MANFNPRISFSLPCDPIPLARPRFTHGRAYLPKRSRDYRELLQAAAKETMQNLGIAPLTGELSCEFEFYRKFKTACRNFGDLDNHIKASLDALQGIIFADDAQVVKVIASKHTDKLNPRCIITIRQNKSTADLF